MKQFANKEDKTVSLFRDLFDFCLIKETRVPRVLIRFFIGGCRPAADGAGRQLFPERVFKAKPKHESVL